MSLQKLIAKSQNGVVEMPNNISISAESAVSAEYQAGSALSCFELHISSGKQGIVASSAEKFLLLPEEDL